MRTPLGPGLRQTRQRRLVWEALGSAGPHCTVEEVMVQVHLRAPRLARSTVYRALDVLIESGAVRALQLGNGPTYYEQAVREHQHAVCQACGQISHLEDDLSAPIERHLEDFHGFKPLRIEVLVFGICDSCSRARRPRTTARRTLEHVHLNRLGLADPAPAGEE